MKIDYTAGSFSAEAYAQMERDRHDCEVRYIASFDTDSRREVYLGRIWDSRGEAVAKRLRADVWDYMQKNGLVKPQEEVAYG